MDGLLLDTENLYSEATQSILSEYNKVKHETTSVPDPGSSAFLPPASGSGMNFSGPQIRFLFLVKFSYITGTGIFRILVMLSL
jgi:hypothetical protein